MSELRSDLAVLLMISLNGGRREDTYFFHDQNLIPDERRRIGNLCQKGQGRTDAFTEKI